MPATPPARAGRGACRATRVMASSASDCRPDPIQRQRQHLDAPFAGRATIERGAQLGDQRRRLVVDEPQLEAQVDGLLAELVEADCRGVDPCQRVRCRRTPGRATRPAPRRGCARGRGSSSDRSRPRRRSCSNRSASTPTSGASEYPVWSRNDRVVSERVAESGQRRPVPRPRCPFRPARRRRRAVPARSAHGSATANRRVRSNCRPTIGVTASVDHHVGSAQHANVDPPAMSVPAYWRVRAM